jgi:hypothetical protein
MEEDPVVKNFIDQWLASHAPTSYEIAQGLKLGETATTVNPSGISVSILPDRHVDEPEFKQALASVPHGQVSKDTKSITTFKPKWQPRWVTVEDKVSSVKPTIHKLEIETLFLRGTSRISPSAYGVGTRESDTEAGRTTLAHHEGSHATCFIQYLTDNAPPTFSGSRGDTKTQLEEKVKTFDTKMKAYYEAMGKRCGPSVDCVGKKASFCP